MKKLDFSTIAKHVGSRYPKPYDEECKQRQTQRMGDAAGLTAFGVNLVRLPPGAWSGQRHWHTHEDEFVYVLEGEPILSTDAGDELMKPGDAAGFKAADANGHCFKNPANAKSDVVLLVVGSRSELDACEYPDVDMRIAPNHNAGKVVFLHKDNTPY